MIWNSLLLSIIIVCLILLLVNHLWKKKKGLSLFGVVKNRYSNLQEPRLRFKQFLVIFFISIILGSYISICYNISNRLIYERKVNGFVEWRSTNQQNYLYIEADDHFSLGYLTGKEVAFKIVLMKQFLIFNSLFIGTTYFELSKISRQYLDYISRDYLDELRGMSEGATFGSGFHISLDDVLVQALLFETIYGRLVSKEENFDAGCTAFGAINKDNSTIIGQNIDLMRLMGPYSYFVLHKLGSNPKIFTFRIGACPAFPIGKNENDLTIVMNLVRVKEKAPIRIPFFEVVRDVLESNELLNRIVEKLFPDEESAYGINFIISNKSDLITIQATPGEQISSFISNTIVQTNTFLYDELGKVLLHPDYSKDRQEYAEDLLDEVYSDNKLSEEELLQILGDKPIICRNEFKIDGTETVAFMTCNSFGIGTTNGNIGEIPI
ncbi:MAG: C45 family autoproteolytic acyltransferase/hydrolase [Promethearchaeota archaeon]